MLSNDRVLVVGVVWSLVLLGLLILREFLKPGRQYRSDRAVRILNLLVAAVIVTFTLAAVLRLLSITVFLTPDTSPAATSQVTPSFTVGPPSIPPPTSTPPSTEMPTLTPAPTLSLAPTPIPTPTVTPTASPSLSLIPTPSPSLVPTPTATPFPTPTPSSTVGGTITVGTRFTVYEVKDGQVTGFREREVAAPFTAPCTSPDDYAAPTLSNPHGHIRLVRILGGPYADVWLSPDDPQVAFKPPG